MIIHGLALILTNLSYIILEKYNVWTNRFAVAGLLLFSVSLLIHATKDLLGIDVNVFALLAPIGGFSYIIFLVTPHLEHVLFIYKCALSTGHLSI